MVSVKKTPAPPPGWGVIIASFAFATLFIAGAVTVHFLTMFETTLTCERATDSCVLHEVLPYRTEERERFASSAMQSATYRYTPGSGSGNRRTSSSACAILAITGRDAMEICPEATEAFVGHVNAYITESSRLRLDARIEPSVLGYWLMGFILLFALLPLYGGIANLTRKLLGQPRLQ